MSVRLTNEQLSKVVQAFKKLQIGIPGKFEQLNHDYKYIGENLADEIAVVHFALELDKS